MDGDCAALDSGGGERLANDPLELVPAGVDLRPQQLTRNGNSERDRIMCVLGPTPLGCRIEGRGSRLERTGGLLHRLREAGGIRSLCASLDDSVDDRRKALRLERRLAGGGVQANGAIRQALLRLGRG
jgi:hypothetical protein